MWIFQVNGFDLTMFFMLFLLTDLTRRVGGIGGKNYLKNFFKEFLAAIDTKNAVLNHLKVFCLFFS